MPNAALSGKTLMIMMMIQQIKFCLVPIQGGLPYFCVQVSKGMWQYLQILDYGSKSCYLELPCYSQSNMVRKNMAFNMGKESCPEW